MDILNCDLSQLSDTQLKSLEGRARNVREARSIESKILEIPNLVELQNEYTSLDEGVCIDVPCKVKIEMKWGVDPKNIDSYLDLEEGSYSEDENFEKALKEFQDRVVVLRQKLEEVCEKLDVNLLSLVEYLYKHRY